MKYELFATLTATVEISDKDFEMLLESSSRHYDSTVQSLSMVGGFLYGAKNRRNFSKGEDNTIQLSVRQIDILLKSLEMDKSEQSSLLYKNLYEIVKVLQKKQTEINSTL